MREKGGAYPVAPENGDSDHYHPPASEFGRNKSKLPIKTIGELIAEAGNGPSWIVEGLLARGALTDFSGLAKKGGKTTFWCHGVVAGARDEDHAGLDTKPAKYLYLTEQGNNFADALRDSGLTEHPDHIRVVQFKDVARIGWDRLVRDAGEEVKRLGFDALIVDTFAVFARLKASEENDAGPVGDRMRVLRTVAQEHDIAVVLIRHAGKDGTPRGSSAFEAEADICAIISRPEGRHAPTLRKLSVVGRYGEWERNIELVDGRYVSVGSDNKIKFNKAVAFVRATLPDSPDAGMKLQDIQEARREGPDKDITASSIKRAVQWLVKQGTVGEKQIMDQRGKPKVYWLAYKPSAGATGDSDHSLRRGSEFGRNEPGSEKEDGDIYFDQTPTPTNVFGRNKSSGVNAPGNVIFPSLRKSEQNHSPRQRMTLVETDPTTTLTFSSPREREAFPSGAVRSALEEKETNGGGTSGQVPPPAAASLHVEKENGEKRRRLTAEEVIEYKRLRATGMGVAEARAEVLKERDEYLSDSSQPERKRVVEA